MKQWRSDASASGGQQEWWDNNSFFKFFFVSYLETLSRKRRHGGWGSEVASWCLTYRSSENRVGVPGGCACSFSLVVSVLPWPASNTFQSCWQSQGRAWRWSTHPPGRRGLPPAYQRSSEGTCLHIRGWSWSPRPTRIRSGCSWSACARWLEGRWG